MSRSNRHATGVVSTRCAAQTERRERPHWARESAQSRRRDPSRGLYFHHIQAKTVDVLPIWVGRCPRCRRFRKFPRRKGSIPSGLGTGDVLLQASVGGRRDAVGRNDFAAIGWALTAPGGRRSKTVKFSIVLMEPRPAGAVSSERPLHSANPEHLRPHPARGERLHRSGVTASASAAQERERKGPVDLKVRPEVVRL